MDIMFDEASIEWRKNKIALKYGMFRYRCGYFIEKKQDYCRHGAILHSDYCHVHKKIKKS